MEGENEVMEQRQQERGEKEAGHESKLLLKSETLFLLLMIREMRGGRKGKVALQLLLQSPFLWQDFRRSIILWKREPSCRRKGL